jgi:hypothetical protein
MYNNRKYNAQDIYNIKFILIKFSENSKFSFLCYDRLCTSAYLTVRKNQIRRIEGLMTFVTSEVFCFTASCIPPSSCKLCNDPAACVFTSALQMEAVFPIPALNLQSECMYAFCMHSRRYSSLKEGFLMYTERFF